jgi:anti-sigma regulatory factor (Ser/Thr protein kinase)
MVGLSLKIKSKLEEILDEKKEVRSSDLLKAFPAHGPLVSYTLKNLVREKVRLKVGMTRGAYYVAATEHNRAARDDEKTRWSKTYENGDLSENDIYEDAILGLPKLKILHENVKSIFDYAFSEMVNNAIDHSQSEKVHVEVEVLGGKLGFRVEDQGIGVFENVKKKRGLNSHYDAALDVLKGKTTTAPDRHSGEGIFFTSKAADRFLLESLKLSLEVDNRLPDVFLEEVSERKGTRVHFEIALDSKRHLNKDVFQPFTVDIDEPAFDKTLVHVKLYRYGTAQISRSQASRLLAGLDKFKTIVLDFERVPSIGQAFADQVFRVFHKKHPEIEIQYANANDAVRYMIERARNNRL